MLASAGRRYLLSLLNSVHAVSPQHCQAGCQQLMLQQFSVHQTSNRSISASTPQQETLTPDSSVEQQQQEQQQLQPNPSASDAPPTDVQPVVQATKRPVSATAQQPLAVAMGPRKVNPSAIGGSKGPTIKREGVVHVNSTMNNTHLVLTDRDSKVETWVSGGTVGYKNANKASPMAAELAAKELARRAMEKGFHSVVVKLKGMGKNKQFAVQSLAASGLTVTQLWDVTPIPYNGCRLPRRRRV